MTGQLLTRGHLVGAFKADLDEQRSPCGRLNNYCHHPRSSYLGKPILFSLNCSFHTLLSDVGHVDEPHWQYPPVLQCWFTTSNSSSAVACSAACFSLL